MLTVVADVVDLLARPVYASAQVDSILALPHGTARRWIDGYTRRGRPYPPVIRERSTGSDRVTWGEFVETRLLAEYRISGVPMLKLRPVVDALRHEMQVPYPLASAAAWLSPNGQELIRRVQETVGLERRLELVVMRTGQRLISWSDEAADFLHSLEWTNDAEPLPRLVRPLQRTAPAVSIDPLRGFGEPVVRGVPTEVIGELHRAGDSIQMIAELYDLTPQIVEEAVRYESSRKVA
jgi:uncharacterized protein (DUF433 family)